MDADQRRLANTLILIPPPRQLNAALRKSALRAQRLANAFDLTVPTADEPGRKPAKLLV
ncbi:MAG: hypothetical protein LBI48_01880 [Burkholderiaceae bacterium]|jgi:hypothetical protein|nr:hypothetical protein [Burkholderiaceae bacterium]